MQNTCACALAIALAVSSTAQADDIPTVKIGANGPEQEIPTDRSFYISGDAGKEASGAVAVVVRKGSASMFGGDGPRCSELSETIHVKQLAEKPLDAGVHKVSEQFPSATDYRENPLLVSASWKPTDTDTTYKLLVPSDKEFFAPGYSFCLYVLVSKKHAEIDDSTIADMIGAAVPKLLACADKPKATKEEISACRTAVIAELRKDLDKRLEAAELVANPKDRKKALEEIIAKVNSSIGPASTFMEDRKNLLAHFAKLPRLPEPTRTWLGVDHGLGRAIATLLGNQGSLFPQLVGPNLVRVVQNSTLTVGAVSVLDDDLRLRVATGVKPSTKEVKTLDGVTTRQLFVDSEVSLHDILSLDRGVIPSEPSLSLDALRQHVENASTEKAWTKDQKDQLEAAAKRLGKIADVMDASFSATTAPTDEASRDATKYHLGRWLQEVKYDPETLVQISAELKQLVANKAKWDTTAPSLAFQSKTEISVDGPQPIPMHIGFTEETWVFSYVTPTIGYAQIDGGDDGWFSHLYLGAQIHFWPNPVNDPLWSHGLTVQDLKRSFALELGFAPSVSKFGPDDRYRGVFGLPPPTVAAALHIVPYTSLSFGAAFLERRQTVLAVEDPKFAPRFFIGLNVQFNIPDFIRAAASKNAPTTVEKK